MFDLSRLLVNPFLDDRISYAELAAYGTESLQRIIANNPGAVLTALIAPTQGALSDLAAVLGDTETVVNARRAAVLGKDAFRAGLAEPLGQIHGALVFKFKAGSPEVVACGLDDRAGFGKCEDGDLAAKLAGVVGGLTPLAAGMGAIGAEVLALATGLAAAWGALFAATGVAKGAVSGARADKQAARKALADALWVNALTIGLKFPGQDDKAALYFPQHLLENPAAPQPQPPGELLSFDATAGAAPLSVAVLAGLPPGATGWALYAQAPGGPAEGEKVGEWDAPDTSEQVVFNAQAAGDVMTLWAVALNGAVEGPASPQFQVTLPA